MDLVQVQLIVGFSSAVHGETHRGTHTIVPTVEHSRQPCGGETLTEQQCVMPVACTTSYIRLDKPCIQLTNHTQLETGPLPLMSLRNTRSCPFDALRYCLDPVSVVFPFLHICMLFSFLKLNIVTVATLNRFLSMFRSIDHIDSITFIYI